MRNRTPVDPAAEPAWAAEALLRRLGHVGEALRPIYESAWLHGVKYRGPYYAERLALERALRAYRQAKPSARTPQKRPLR